MRSKSLQGILLTALVSSLPFWVAFSPSAASTAVAGTGEIQGTHFLDLNANGRRDTDEPGRGGVRVYLDTNGDQRPDPDEPQVISSSEPGQVGQFRFSALAPGTYIVRTEIPSGTMITAPRYEPDGFADRVLSFFDSGAGLIPGPYGSLTTSPPCEPTPVDPDLVLGQPPPPPRLSHVNLLSLPQGSYVTLAFLNETIIDGPGPDLTIVSIDPVKSAGELADIFVSADLENFAYLGRVFEGENTGLEILPPRLEVDLADLGFSLPVRAIRIVGSDTYGCLRGFDFIGAEITPTSIGPAFPDQIVQVEPDQIVTDIDFGTAPLRSDSPPTISGIADVTLSQDEAERTIPFHFNDSETPPERLKVSVHSWDPSLLPRASIRVQCNGTNGLLTITPPPDRTGKGMVLVTVTDSDRNTTGELFEVTIRPANDPAQE